MALETTRNRGELIAALLSRVEVLEARVEALEAAAGDDLVGALLTRLGVLEAREAGIEARLVALELAITPEFGRTTREPPPEAGPRPG